MISTSETRTKRTRDRGLYQHRRHRRPGLAERQHARRWCSLPGYLAVCNKTWAAGGKAPGGTQPNQRSWSAGVGPGHHRPKPRQSAVPTKPPSSTATRVVAAATTTAPAFSASAASTLGAPTWPWLTARCGSSRTPPISIRSGRSVLATREKSSAPIPTDSFSPTRRGLAPVSRCPSPFLFETAEDSTRRPSRRPRNHLMSEPTRIGLGLAARPALSRLGVVLALCLALAGCDQSARRRMPRPGPAQAHLRRPPRRSRPPPAPATVEGDRLAGSVLAVTAPPTSREPSPFRFTDVARQSGIDFVHFSGMTPDKHFPTAERLRRGDLRLRRRWPHGPLLRHLHAAPPRARHGRDRTGSTGTWVTARSAT